MTKRPYRIPDVVALVVLVAIAIGMLASAAFGQTKTDGRRTVVVNGTVYSLPNDGTISLVDDGTWSSAAKVAGAIADTAARLADESGRRVVCPVCERDGAKSRVYPGEYPGHGYGVPYEVENAPTWRYWGGEFSILTPALPSVPQTTTETEDEPLEFFDEDGRYHNHDLDGQVYHCSRGHEFELFTEHCWCGWPTEPLITRE